VLPQVPTKLVLVQGWYYLKSDEPTGVLWYWCIKQVYIPSTCLYIIPALAVTELEISFKGLGNWTATPDKTGLNPGLVPTLLNPKSSILQRQAPTTWYTVKHLQDYKINTLQVKWKRTRREQGFFFHITEVSPLQRILRPLRDRTNLRSVYSRVWTVLSHSKP
jgi:hypothetical protein